MSERRPIHRIFGLSWVDFFLGTAVTVETELDLSLKRQLLDLVIIRPGNEPLPGPLPDGFDDFAVHNLLTFKSHREALAPWAVWELVGHFVNYRKQSSPSFDDLLPEDDFRLYAVCARFPSQLAGLVDLVPVRDGVYDALGFGLRVRIIVAAQLPLADHNAMLHLFSARADLLRYGQEHYQPRSPETSTLLYELFQEYGEELEMSDKLKEYVRESLQKIIANLPARERLKGLSAQERLQDLSAQECLQNFSARERLEDLSVEDVAQALSPEKRRQLARLLSEDGPSAANNGG